MDVDISLSAKGLFEVLKTYFPDIRKDNGMITGNFKDRPYSIRVKNITYLGIPHPVFKKRIQISGDLKNFYKDSLSRGMTPLLLGIYTRDDLTLFCDFNIEDFVAKKSNNSSAHVYTEDLSFAAEDGIFQKTDYRGNHITVFRPGSRIAGGQCRRGFCVQHPGLFYRPAITRPRGSASLSWHDAG